MAIETIKADLSGSSVLYVPEHLVSTVEAHVGGSASVVTSPEESVQKWRRDRDGLLSPIAFWASSHNRDRNRKRDNGPPWMHVVDVEEVSIPDRDRNRKWDLAADKKAVIDVAYFEERSISLAGSAVVILSDDKFETQRFLRNKGKDWMFIDKNGKLHPSQREVDNKKRDARRKQRRGSGSAGRDRFSDAVTIGTVLGIGGL